MSASDPNGFVRNPPSVIVKIQNTSQASVNGKLGIVIQFNQERSRYMVHLTETQTTVSLKPDNLIKATMLEQAQAQYQQLTRDPQIKREFTKYYNIVASKLPQGVTPEYAAIGFGIFLLVIIYFVGFTRFLMTISLFLLIGMIIGPDLVRTNGIPDWRLIANNFPGRARALIEESVPMLRGKISDQIAAGVVLIFLFLTARSILMPIGSSKAASAAAAAAAGQNKGEFSLISAESIEEAYRLGFEDGTSGKMFGTSKPTTSLNNPIFDMDEDIPFPQPATLPSQPWYSKIGIWQAFGIMNIGRTAYEMGRDVHGVFSPQLLVANLRTADPMRLGLLGLSVYNLLKIFF